MLPAIATASISPDDYKDAQGFIRWNPQFELGIPVIDAQHQKLVALCNNLQKEIVAQRGTAGDWHEPLKAALKECADYVLVHFRDEEVLMKGAAYPRLPEHKKAHDAFTQKVLETVRRFNLLSIADALQFVHFLYEWILTHIAYEDKLFAKPVIDYLKTKKVIV